MEEWWLRGDGNMPASSKEGGEARRLQYRGRGQEASGKAMAAARDVPTAWLGRGCCLGGGGGGGGVRGAVAS
jgi:hypothetical protein